MHNEKAKALALVALAANFGKELPEPLFNLWLDLLQPYPTALVEAAVKKVVLEYAYKTLPPFAVLQKALNELCGTGEKSLDLQATAEWVALLEQIETRGRNRPPEHMHATTAYVLRIMGGWQAACSWPENALEFKRRDFLGHWTECHGNVDAMALGAAGLLSAIRGLPQRFVEEGAIAPREASLSRVSLAQGFVEEGGNRGQL